MKRLITFAILAAVSLSSVPYASSQEIKDGLAVYNEPPSRLRGVIEKFNQDYGSLDRLYTASTSVNRTTALRRLYDEQLEVLDRQKFDALNHDEQIDLILFRNYLEHENAELERGRTNWPRWPIWYRLPQRSAISKIH